MGQQEIQLCNTQMHNQLGFTLVIYGDMNN